MHDGPCYLVAQQLSNEYLLTYHSLFESIGSLCVINKHPLFISMQLKHVKSLGLKRRNIELCFMTN